MTDWQFEVHERVTPAATPEACFGRIVAQARRLGFEFCTHCLRLPLPITRPRTTICSNYPPAWLARYGEKQYIEIDPIIAYGMRSSAPLIWNDALFASVPELWEDAKAHGLRHGWAQSRRDHEGIYSMLVLARSEGAIDEATLQRDSPRLQWLTHVSHDAMKASGIDALQFPEVTLSAREVEVLRWTAEGKTSAEVADILRISERTVNFHVNSAITKFGASNKTSATVRAAVLGLLW